MDKYGVRLDRQKMDKAASKGCPKCKGAVTDGWCPACGTKPMEESRIATTEKDHKEEGEF